MNNYWAQWSREEIEEMQGLEEMYKHFKDEHDIDLDQSEDDIDLEQYESDMKKDQDEDIEEQLSLETLGISWRDFM